MVYIVTFGEGLEEWRNWKLISRAALPSYGESMNVTSQSALLTYLLYLIWPLSVSCEAAILSFFTRLMSNDCSNLLFWTVSFDHFGLLSTARRRFWCCNGRSSSVRPVDPRRSAAQIFLSRMRRFGRAQYRRHGQSQRIWWSYEYHAVKCKVWKLNALYT